MFAHWYTYGCATPMPEMHIGRSALRRLLHHTIYINMYITNCSWRDMNRIAMGQLFCLMKLPYNCDSVTATAHVRWVQGEAKQEQCDVLLIKLCDPCLYIRMSKTCYSQLQNVRSYCACTWQGFSSAHEAFISSFEACANHLGYCRESCQHHVKKPARGIYLPRGGSCEVHVLPFNIVFHKRLCYPQWCLDFIYETSCTWDQGTALGY